jgi:hypothetical protein
MQIGDKLQQRAMSFSFLEYSCGITHLLGRMLYRLFLNALPANCETFLFRRGMESLWGSTFQNVQDEAPSIIDQSV